MPIIVTIPAKKDAKRELVFGDKPMELEQGSLLADETAVEKVGYYTRSTLMRGGRLQGRGLYFQDHSRYVYWNTR